jgi:hypothetical protein
MKNRLSKCGALASAGRAATLHDYLDPSIDWTPDLTDPDETCDTKGCIDEWCSAFPEHFRLVEIFTAAGFAVVRVEKIWCAHLWNVSLLRGTSELPTDYRPAARRIRTLLDRNGIPVDREPPALRLTGDRISAAFNWRAGEVGAVCRRSGGGYDTVRTPDYQPDEQADAE